MFLPILHKAYISIEKNIIDAPEGTCNLYDMRRPPKQATYPIIIEAHIICLNLLVNKFAIICGIVSNDIASTIPIIRKHATIVIAMNIIIIYSNNATGKC